MNNCYMVNEQVDAFSQTSEFLINAQKKAESHVNNIRFLSDHLLSTSDFIGEDFIYLALCVYNINFFPNTVSGMFIENINALKY